MLLAIFSPILGINEVYAQESTNTPTWQPLFPTGTPRPTINSNCPDGQPIGWQTVTPSFNWLNYCSQCIGRPTADWSDIDQQFTPWPELYISHLGNCTLEELDDGCEIVTHGAGLACQCMGYPTPTPSGGVQTPQPDHYYIAHVDEFTTCTQGEIPTYIDSCAPGDVAVGEKIEIQKTYGADLVAYWWTGASGNVGSWGDYVVRWAGSTDWATIDADTGLNIEWGAKIYNNGIMPSTAYFYTDGGTRCGYLKRTLVCRGAESYIPSTNSDYCNEVEAKPVYEADEVGLELPTPAYGQGQCVVIGFNIGTAWLENLFPNLFQFNVPDSLGVPDFQVCLRPMTLGDINIFGLLIDVDYLLLAASLIMVVRWLFRS